MNTQVKLSAELEDWAWLRHHLEQENFDAVALMSALESETHIPECLLELAEEAIAVEKQVAAAKERAKEITERAGRLAEKAEKLRRVITATMVNARIDKPIQGPTLTISKRIGGRGLIITDQTKIPKEYYDDAEPKLSKQRVRDALDMGKNVPGATLSNGGFSCAILTK